MTAIPTPTPSPPPTAPIWTFDGLSQWSPVIGNLGQAVQAIVVILAAVYAYWQLRESRATRRAHITLQLLERLNDHNVALRKRRLYKTVAKRINHPRDSDERLLGQIANEYHAIGYVLKLGLIDRDVILGIHYGAVCRAWRAMEPWVMKQRKSRGTLYGEYFEYLRDEAKEYMRRERPLEYAAQKW